MININSNKGTNYIETVAEGKLTKEDYDKLIPVIEEKFSKFDKLKWYFEVKNFDGWTIKGFWSDLKIDFTHRNDFEKVAIVGNKKWHEWMAEVMKPFTKSEIKYFERFESDKAKNWIKN